MTTETQQLTETVATALALLSIALKSSAPAVAEELARLAAGLKPPVTPPRPGCPACAKSAAAMEQNWHPQDSRHTCPFCGASLLPKQTSALLPP